ncbi:hypothetical protein [Clostridium sp.]|uniref:hypothetical protein n=1 Tax=Clostridium sp. TaxID=1506 RepID=UPI0032166D0B
MSNRNTNINDISKEINVTLKSILKNLESACEAAKEKSNKTMSEMAANYKLVMAGIADFNNIKPFIESIKWMKKGWKDAKDALAGYGDLSRVTLGTLNGGLPITTMLVGVLTGEITLATAAQAAWNAVMNANPIVLVITAVAALTAGIAAYSSMQDNVCQGEERLNEANEALGNSYEKIATGIVSFHDGIKSAGSILDGFNDSIIVSNEEQQNLSTRMDEVQSEITEIARAATNERGSLTESEIQRLDELFVEMQELTQRELEIQEAYQDVVKDRAEVVADTHAGTLEEYQTYSQKLINSAEETREAVIQKADEQCTEEIALINAKYEALGTIGSDAYNAEIEAANNKYTTSVEAANKECGDTLSIIQEGYANRATAFQEYTELHEGLKLKEEESDAAYHSALEEEEARHNEALRSGGLQAVVETSRHSEAMQQIENEHNNELARIREAETANLNDNVINQASALLEMVANTEFYGGQVSEETKTMANGILDNLDKLPEDARKSMENAMSPMLDEMQKAEPGLWDKATSIASGILSRLNKAFDIHSPSRETRKIFKYVMQGAEFGMDDETSNLYDQTDDISKSVLERFNATKFDMSSLANRMKATVDYNMSSTTVGIVARNNQDASTISSNLNSDDIQEDSTFIVPVYMDSEKISEYTYKKVDGKFALAGKRVR